VCDRGPGEAVEGTVGVVQKATEELKEGKGRDRILLFGLCDAGRRTTPEGN